MTDKAINIQGLTKFFVYRGERRLALRNISFSIEAGRIVGLFGPSGCGKTTLLRIICGVLPFDEGDVFLFDRPVAEQRGKVAYVPQHNQLLDWLTIRQNALLGWAIMQRNHSQDEQAVIKRANYLFENFKLEDLAKEYPRRCSGGERQRAALIRALLMPVNVLALDEPVGGIDYITRAQIYQELLSVIQAPNDFDRSTTILVVSHDPEELLYLCDEVIFFSAQHTRLGTLKVPFPRPRNRDLIFSHEFVDLKCRLWSSLDASHPI